MAIVFQPYWKGGWSFPFFFQKKNHLLNLQVLEFLMSSIFLHSLASRIFQAQIRRYIDTLNSLLILKTIVSIYLSSSTYLNKSTHQIRFTIKKMQAFVFPLFPKLAELKRPGISTNGCWEVHLREEVVFLGVATLIGRSFEHFPAHSRGAC